MEAVRTYTTQMLEGSLLEHDHSVVNIQPLPQALSFSPGRGERMVMNRKGERDVWIRRR